MIGAFLLTHDLSTMLPPMRHQLTRALQCAPIVLVPALLPIGLAIEEILLLETCADESDWAAGLVYLPLD